VDRYRELGARLVAISPQKVQYNRAMQEEKKLDFMILSDPGNRVAQRYGIKYSLPEDLQGIYKKFGNDLAKFNREEPWTLPMPARLIVDTDGVIRYAEINADYKERPEPEHTLAALKNLTDVRS